MALLSETERQVSAVKKLLKFYTDRLQTYRLKNDNTPLESTERLRGKIAEAKKIISILEGSETVEIEESNDTVY